ncbi:MAG: pimeloyl-ACP methyl esterase BioG family protein [Bacteroides sp.]
MNLYWHTKENNKNLILIFNGWGCDEHILVGVHKNHYDLLLLSDYSDLDHSFLREIELYESIVVIAWSFGVTIANYFLSYLSGVSLAIAVNGTVYPVDNDKGIPTPIFQATLQGFSALTSHKFFLRMMGGAKNLKRYELLLPKRSISDQQKELNQFRKWAALNTSISTKWSQVIIGMNDLIFPLQNMQKAWIGYPVELKQRAHFIPFQEIIDAYL